MNTKTIPGIAKVIIGGVIAVLLVLAISYYSGSRSGVLVDHPYADVDWASFTQYKANLHTHTKAGDTKIEPADVVDMYHDHGYKILALTDHDTNITEATTWPWQDFGRDPAELGMVAIEGNEISKLHHIGSLYSGYGNAKVTTEEEVFQKIGELDGIAAFNHPGRYTHSDRPERVRTVDWYCDYYLRHPHIYGMEVYNQMDRYPTDRATWDAVLTQLLPGRPVWGTANDDMHEPSKSFGYSWNIVILPELGDALVRDALVNGQFFFAHAPNGRAGPQVPTIEKITVNERSGTISIQASGHTSIDWIAEGEVVQQGADIDLSQVAGAKYVRAMVHGPEGTVVGTQPFILAH